MKYLNRHIITHHIHVVECKRKTTFSDRATALWVIKQIYRKEDTIVTQHPDFEDRLILLQSYPFPIGCRKIVKIKKKQNKKTPVYIYLFGAKVIVTKAGRIATAFPTSNFQV